MFSQIMVTALTDSIDRSTPCVCDRVPILEHICTGIAFKAIVYTASFNSCNWCQRGNVEQGRRKATRGSKGDGEGGCNPFSVCMKKSDIDLFR